MTPERWQKLDQLVQSALSLPPEERPSFLEDSCIGDPRLRQQVDEMLAALSQAQGFLEVPALEAAARLMASHRGDLEGTQIGRYRILSLIGAGGMGEVYCARDEELERDVAIKVLAEAGTSSSARLYREARAAAALNHPNVCTIHEVGEHEGDAYIVMEYIEGRPLTEWIAGSELSAGDVLRFSIEIAEAIAHAHNNGIVHGDLKAANILVNNHRHAKVLDFGLARRVDHAELIEMTKPTSTTGLHVNAIVGTLPYMAPEQYLGRNADARSDAWSLGVVFFEMAAGFRPFQGKTTFELSAAVLSGTPKALPPHVPPELRAVIQRCLSKDATDRYQDATEIVGALRQSVAAKKAALPPLRPAVTRRMVLAIGCLLLVSIGLAVVLDPAHHRQEQSPMQSTTVTAPEAPRVKEEPVAIPVAAASTDSKDPDYRMFRLQAFENAVAPALSPDGVWVAYIQQNGSLQSLAIRQTTRAAQEFRVMRDVEIVPAEPGVNLLGMTVEPDGRFIDYVRSRDSGYELWQVPFLKGQPRLLLENIDSLPGWTPDGQKMAFVRTDASGASSSLILMDSRDRKERVIATRNAPMRFLSIRSTTGNVVQAPSWSPDGASIALLGGGQTPTSRGPHVVVVDFASGSERLFAIPAELPNPEVRSTAVAWLSDKTLLVNRRLRAGESLQLWRLNYPEGEFSRITNDLNNYSSFSVASASKDVASAAISGQRDIWVGNGEGEKGENLPEAVKQGVRFGVQKIAWLGNQVLSDDGAGEQRQIFGFTLPNGSAVSLISRGFRPASTSDGRTIVFISAEKENPGLWKIDAQGLHRTLLVAGEMGAAVVTPDNRQVVFVRQRDGVASLWTVGLEGGVPKLLVDEPLLSPDISRDGSLLLFGTRDDANPSGYIAVCQLPGCTSRQRYLPAAVANAGFKWMPDGKAFAFAAASDPANLWAQPLDGRAPYSVTRLPSGSIVDFSWSHDGQRLAILRETTRREIVLIKGLPGRPR